MNLDLAQQLFADGIVDGSFFALLAVSWSVIYATSGVFHFAHALTFVIAAYTAALVVDTGSGRFVGLVAGVLAAVVFGALTELVLYRYLRTRGATGFGMFLASMGLYIAGINVVELLVGSEPRSIGRFTSRAFDIGAIRITLVDLVMMLVAWSTLTILIVLEQRTRWGRAMTATRSNPVMATSVGVDIRRVYVVAFALGSGVVGLAAFYFTAKNAAQPSMGIGPIISGLVAMFLGGVGRTSGAVLGALVLGVSQNMGGLWLPGHWQVIVSFVILFGVLLWRPEGLLPAR